MRRREFILTAAGLGAAVGLAACGKSGSSTTPGASAGASASSGEVTGEVKVTFQQFGNSKVQANFLNGWAKKFTAAHPQATVKLQPITASENDYYTKLQLSMRSPRTAPDMCYEDTFLINSDIAAGYLTAAGRPISSWPDWSQFKDDREDRGAGLDGKTYGDPRRHRHPRPLVQQEDLREGGPADGLAAEDLGRRPHRSPDDQGQGARRHPAQRLRRHRRRRGGLDAGLRDAPVRHPTGTLFDNAESEVGGRLARRSPTR